MSKRTLKYNWRGLYKPEVREKIHLIISNGVLLGKSTLDITDDLNKARLRNASGKKFTYPTVANLRFEVIRRNRSLRYAK